MRGASHLNVQTPISIWLPRAGVGDGVEAGWGCYIPCATPDVQIYMNLTSLCDQDASAVRAETPRMRAVANRNNCERGWKAPEVHEKIVDFKFPEKAPKRAPDTPKHASSAPKRAQTHLNASDFDGLASFTCQIARGGTIRAFLVLGRPQTHPNAPQTHPNTPQTHPNSDSAREVLTL